MARDTIFLPLVLVLVVIALTAYRRQGWFSCQPIRSRTGELLRLISASSQSEGGIDYQGLCWINTMGWMIEYGFPVKDLERVTRGIGEKMGGFICVPGPTRTMYDLGIIQACLTVDGWPKRRYQCGQPGAERLEIDRIFLTRKFVDYYAQLEDFANDPLLPESVLLALDDLRNEIRYNVRIALRQAIAESLARSVARSTSSDHGTIDPVAVYNQFSLKRLHHDKVMSILHKATRSDLSPILRLW